MNVLRKEVGDVKNFTQSVLAMSAASVSVRAESACPLAASTTGAGIREHVELTGSAVTVRSVAPTAGFMRDKSALILAKQVRTATRNTQQLSGYGFGTPVGVDAPRVDVATGVPPRSRPV
jgi:hypothetical protein